MDGYGVVPSLAGHDWGTQGFTVTVFFKPTRMVHRRMVLVSNGAPPNHHTFAITMEPVADGRGGVRKDQVALAMQASSHRAYGTIHFQIPVSGKEWVFAALSFSPADGGVLRGMVGAGHSTFDKTSPLYDEGAARVHTPASNPVVIGASTPAGQDAYCGLLHDLRIYDVGLTLDEIRGLRLRSQHTQLFGDESASLTGTSPPSPATVCATTEWSEWGSCCALDWRTDRSWRSAVGGVTPTVSTRTRHVVHGDSACSVPDLFEVIWCPRNPRSGAWSPACAAGLSSPLQASADLVLVPYSSPSTRLQGLTLKSQIGQDKFVLERIFRRPDGTYKHGGVFVDIGAHDGVTFSNSYTLETSFGWTGVCVEPLAGPFAQLTRARSCVAINACAYNETTTVTFQNISGVSEMLSGIVNAYDPLHVYRIGLEMNLTTGDNRRLNDASIIEVPAVRIADVLQAQGITHVDMMSIDTENSEVAVLQGLDFSAVTVDVFVIEDAYASGSWRLYNFLEAHGYEVLDTVEFDTIFVRQDAVLADLGMGGRVPF